MSKSKHDENLKDKIKNLFRRKTDNPSLPKGHNKELNILITPETLKDIGPESPSNNRIKTIKDLSEVVLKKKLEENAIEAVWCSVQDLYLPQTASDKRHAALHFLQCLLEGQYKNLSGLRSHFFHVVQSLTLLENIDERLALFKILSDSGKTLLEFEEEAGPFLLSWMPDVIVTRKICNFLPLLISVIKFNAAYMDEEIIAGLVKQTCVICNRPRSDDHLYFEELKWSLDMLESVLSYSYLPSDTLRDVVLALCRMVNIPKFCEPSWARMSQLLIDYERTTSIIDIEKHLHVANRCLQIISTSLAMMKKLLGTHHGHSAIYTMCNMLQLKTEPVELLRGAVFYIGMAMWGSGKVSFLKHTPAAVLPSFLHVLPLGSAIIGYEVTLSVQRLVKKYGKDLPDSTWDIVLNILEIDVKQLESNPKHWANPQHSVDLHETLTFIEQLYEHGQFSGSVDRFFKIIEMCAMNRPEHSVILLISHISQSIHPAMLGWISALFHLLDRYFRNETRTKIRLKALDVLSFILSINKHIYEDELINNIVLPLLCHIENDNDANIRQFSCGILLGLAQGCMPHTFIDVITVVEKVISRPLVGKPIPSVPTVDNPETMVDESHLSDVKSTVISLVDLFKEKLYSYPPGLCIKLYDMLVSHLTLHYTYPNNYTSHTAAAVRKPVMECLLNLRADMFHKVGILNRSSEDGHFKYSPYITCDKNESEKSPPRSPASTTPNLGLWCNMCHLEYRRAFFLFIQCLENEKDWEVLKCVLENLPVLLQNKAVILSSERWTLVDTLCSKLCAMVNDRQLGFPEKLIGVPPNFTRSDFHTYVFPVLGAMVTYHDFLDRNRQKDLIKCLEFGMVSKCAKLCVIALRLCTLEMQDVMMRLLPSVLLQLSKISATISMAIPVLAFLSSIVRLPKMYANFVEDEYMSVFAIALPYTNPFKFSHYTVSLSHHVIAIWFIRCRMPFRKGFVQFIQKGLKANVLQQFEENARLALQSQNQDSSDRVRSGSYSEAALRSPKPKSRKTSCVTDRTPVRTRRRRMQSGSAISRTEINAPVDSKLSQFHRELTETCTDVMARYTFGNFSPIPHRSHMAEFLLAGGQSQTWLLGNKLLTITTSGSGNKVGNSGVCEKCQATYQAAEQKDQKSGRRRHKSAIVINRSTSMVEPGHRHSQDDMTVPSKTSIDDLGFDISGQDVGVQTGSSLSDSAGLLENEPLESLIFGMKASDSGQLPINICNCWCTNWAEIYIRAPSGNLSWMMRIENEAGLYSLSDSQVQDITMLLASMGKKRSSTRPNVVRHNRRIESGSIGEEEYETLYKQHFEANHKQDSTESQQHHVGDLPQIAEFEASGSADRPDSLPVVSQGSTLNSTTENPTADTHQVSDALQIPSSEAAKNHDVSPGPGSLRRSNSSPSILSGSSDTLSPRDSISDIVQFGPLTKSDGRKSVPKSSDSDRSYFSEKMISQQGDVVKAADEDVIKITETNQSVNVKQISESETSQDNETSVSASVTKEYTSMLTRQLSPSPVSSESSSILDEVGELPTNLKRHRGHTVAATQSTSSQSNVSVPPGAKGSGSDSGRVGISPSFVFLQLYHNGQIQVNEAPILLPNNDATERAIKMLDHIYPYETHKIGVIYIGQNQVKDEKAILSNLYGSDRYMKFVHSLGSLFRLKDCNPQQVYLGGLDTKGNDGEYTYGWRDESTQMIFHVATLMPNKESDPNCNAKKLHIGNDYVTVVYNDSGDEWKIGVIKGQFNYVNIVIKPLDYESNAVTLQAKEVPFQDKITTGGIDMSADLDLHWLPQDNNHIPWSKGLNYIAGILGHTDCKVISDTNLAPLVRQIAIHCNLASMVLQRQASQPQDPFANNWLERLRKIRRIKSTLVDEKAQDPESPSSPKTLEDFTQYV